MPTKKKKDAIKKPKPKAKAAVKKRSPSGEKRSRRGTFVKGNPGGPGRPKGSSDKAEAHELKAALVAAVTTEDIAAITRALVEKAKKGNPYAAVVLFDRIWGKAPQDVNLGGNASAPIICTWKQNADGND